MERTGSPTNGDHFTLNMAGEHYGFADFDYHTTAGVETQTFLTLGKNYYVQMPMRADFCFAAIIVIPLLLIAVSVLFFKCRRHRPTRQPV